MKNNNIKAPIAEKHSEKSEKHGDIRIDNYSWMRLTDEQKNRYDQDEQTKKVLNYLTAENDYYNKVTEHTKSFQEELFQEMKSRIKEKDELVPYKKNEYYYITCYEEGKQYPIYSRKKGTLEASEEILFDVNTLAKGYDYFQLGDFSVSPNNHLVAFSVDTVSRRQYVIKIKNLITGVVYNDVIKNTTPSITWANDNRTLYYSQQDSKTLRSYKIFKHILGTSSSDDEEVFHEKNEMYNVYIHKTTSTKYLVISTYSTLSSEHWILHAHTPEEKFQVIQPRIQNLEYEISHYENHFYILTNKDGAKNFKLMKTPETKTLLTNWIDIIPHREDVLLEGFHIFKDYLVLDERINGLTNIKIKRWDNSIAYYLSFDEETYSIDIHDIFDFDTDILRYGYSSLTTPYSVIDFSMTYQLKEIKKEEKILGGKFNKKKYISKRIWVTARDGKEIALSLVYRKDTEINKKTSVLLYGYGSYGYTVPDDFKSTRLSLLDRGFVCAIAHIRGGEYLNREWYENGKFLHKKNTFTDFIDCSKYLIENTYTSSDHLYAMGGSAGGLLMGAIVNMNAELYKGVIVAVPFVDVLSTMLDETIPLTVGEYEEWGNPNDKVYYDYIKSYSPYDNVVAQDYPYMLVTTGFYDSQVQYWEPLKWVAKLRELKTDNHILLLKTDMKTGHGGASGRFDSMKETAIRYTFLLDLENKIP